MKTRNKRYKIDWLKLISFIIGIITLIYFTICTISYTIKTTNKAKEYMPQEKTMIINN